MAYLKLYRKKLQENFDFLQKQLEPRTIHWGIVSKLLCGERKYLKELTNLGASEIHDSRISNLRVVKELNPDVQTVYIKPPAKRSIEDIVRYADVSFNTEYITLKMLSEEAVRQERQHKVIIMIEMGDLREGVLGDELLNFYEKVFDLPNIEVRGIGANFNCMHGVLPSEDKLVQLALYKQLIELKFNQEIPFVSGGTSITLPLLFRGSLPAGINHFRIGETLYFGADILNNETVPGMHDDVLELFAEIIELTEKPVVPTGVLAETPSGELMEFDEKDYGRKAYRAILDLGLLDMSPEFLIPNDERIEILNASSDMLIIDLGDSNLDYEVGDVVSFKLKYMGALRLLNSNYIEKIVE